VRSANLLLKFLLELCAFAAPAYAGVVLFDGAAAVAVAVLLPLAAIVAWGRWAAPRSSHRLPRRARIPFELGVFALAAAGLVLSRAPVLATVFAVAVVVNAVLLTVLDQWEA
jgi:hypothetical protein